MSSPDLRIESDETEHREEEKKVGRLGAGTGGLAGYAPQMEADFNV
jgi:hypothetical protein